VWTLVASRAPARHLNWVKFVLTFPIALFVTLVLAVVRGHVTLDQVLIDMAVNAGFVTLLVLYYPRGVQPG
jgi:hypothetical protein